ncbi:MAG: hypothetical protein ACOYOU_17195 [Kiritimatiellia bacterium]
MSASRSRLPLDRAVREALVDALKLKLPPGQPLTIDALEAATGQLLRELGPQLMEEVIQGGETAPKKGALLSAATARPPSKGPTRAR